MAVDFRRTELLRFDDDQLINGINIKSVYYGMIVKIFAAPPQINSNFEHNVHINASNLIK